MIDGIKIMNLPVDYEAIINHNLLTFPLSNISTEGEFLNRSQNTKYRGLFISVSNQKVKVRGSLHKYFNNGLHNSNDFSFTHLQDTIKDFSSTFNFNPKQAKLNCLEFGLNIQLPFNPNKFIQNLIQYKGVPFISMTNKGVVFGRECILKNYTIKVYNKGYQSNTTANTLRFEIAVKRMQYFKDQGINITSLEDLSKFENIQLLKSPLIDCLKNIMVYNGDIDLNQVEKEKDKYLLLEGRYCEFWIRQKEADRKKYYRKLERFKKLGGIDAEMQKEIVQLMIKKWDKLAIEKTQNKALNISNKTRVPTYNLIAIFTQFKIKKRDKLTIKIKCQSHLFTILSERKKKLKGGSFQKAKFLVQKLKFYHYLARQLIEFPNFQYQNKGSPYF